MEVRTFIRIQRVIWNHLLAFKAEIIQKQALFQFRAKQLTKNNYELELIVQSALFFLSFSFLTCQLKVIFLI